MLKKARLWQFFLFVCLTASFGVFVLPFFFPVAAKAAISVSNAAGFNNKVAAIAAALCAVGALVVFVRKPQWLLPALNEQSSLARPVPFPVWLGIALVVAACSSAMSWLVFVSRLPYTSDSGYFIAQMTSHAIYHRQLYSQIEFPYGPLLFYPPILLHSLLAGWHISMDACYFAFHSLNQFVGVLLLGYVVNALPMSRRWKLFAVGCFAVFTFEPMVGLNYTLFRFMAAPATLIFCTKRQRPIIVALLFTLGEIFTLSVSAEMGFAFAAGSIAYALLRTRLSGRVWIPAVAAPLLGCALFLLVVGLPYLRWVALMGGGTYNFIVEPVPHVLLLLIALVWLVPRLLATRLNQRADEVILLGSCCVLSLALLPVAFGRADPLHVYFDGIVIVLLSLAAMTSYPNGKQLIWGVCIAGSMLLGYVGVLKVYRLSILEVAYTDAALYPRSPLTMVFFHTLGKRGRANYFKTLSAESDLDTNALQAIIGSDTVATPFFIGTSAESQLKQHNWYRPDFYFYMFDILDDAAEQRKIRDFNEAKWALLPTGVIYHREEDQAFADSLMGIRLPYLMKHPQYVIGKKFMENLQTGWAPVAKLNDYTLYHRKT